MPAAGYALASLERALKAADGCRDMAARHLEFNVKGHGLAKKLIADCAAKDQHAAPAWSGKRRSPSHDSGV